MQIAVESNQLVEWIDNGQLVSFLNPFSYLQVSADPILLAGIDRWGFDGKALQLICQCIKQMKIERISFDFTSLADPCFSYCEQRELRVAIVGSDTESLQRFAAIVRKIYPALLIVYTRDGYFTAEQRSQSLVELAALAPDVLICGMGAGLQERFLLDLRQTGWRGAGFTCGGFIHQTASAGGDYYPAWVDRLNLRFLYRMWDEPKLIKRYLIDYPKGMWRFYHDCRNRSDAGNK